MTHISVVSSRPHSRPRHVYVHIPFCARRCVYCDFAITIRSRVPVDEYLSALRSELALRYAPGEAWDVETLYLGGGTPSLLGGNGVERLLDALRAHLSLEAAAEVTLEANPDDVVPDAVSRWRDAGVNRLSLGAQSFDDGVLAWMHRTHDAARIEQAVEHARAGGITNVSLDLIFALPARLGRSWERDVEKALALAPDHVSLYGLTVEPATPLGRWRSRGDVAEATEESYEEEYLFAHARLTAAGYEHYEVSSFARPGRRSRHNSSYWTGVAYAGLGPSAHEFDGTVRRWNAKSYRDWVELLAGGRDPVAGRGGGAERLTDENRLAERVYLGLRTDAGLPFDESSAASVERWIESGWGALHGGRLRLTAEGWLRLDSLAADLTARGSR